MLKGGLSARTVQYHHRILSESLSHAVKMGLLSRNVAEAVHPPRVLRKNIATLAPEDVPIFLAEAAKERTPYYVLFYTALYTGMRLGELLGLRWCDVDLDMASLSVVQALYKRSGVCQMIEPKSFGSRRRIALSPSLALLLRRYKTEQQAERILLGGSLGDSVFRHIGGKPLDPGVVSHTFARVLEKAGLPHIRFHDLRHSHATLLLKGGVHAKIVSERLGHANIGITLDTYSHVLPGLQERAAERLDELLTPIIERR